jgi:hypothetical protein
MIESFLMLAFAVSGFAAIILGVSMWSGPAGLVTFGASCLVMALWPLLRTKWFT